VTFSPIRTAGCWDRASSGTSGRRCVRKDNKALIHPDDAAALGVSDGDRVRVFSPVGAIELAASLSERPRRGVIVVDHGWGSRVFDPRGGAEPQSFGVNRNLLVDAGPVDPLSQTSALSSSYVGVERLGR